MENEITILTEEQKSEIFTQDTISLSKCITNFVQNFYPAYSISNENIVALEKENSLELLNTFTFYKLSECTVDNIDELFPFFVTKMQKLFTTAYSIKQEVCYGIVSNNNKTSLVIGISPSSSDTTIKRIIEGLLPGMKIEKYQDKFVNSRQEIMNEQYDKDRFVGCISGVPTLKLDGKLQNKDLSSLMRSLNGENYTIMVLCKPVDEVEIQNKINTAIEIQDKCFAISKRTFSLQKGSSNSNTHSNIYNESDGNQESETKGRNVSGALGGVAAGAAIGSIIPGVGTLVGAIGGGLIGLIVGQQFSFNKSKNKGTSHTVTKGYSDAVTETINSNESISADIQNGFALELMKMAETMSDRLKIGRSIGMWESIVTYSSDSEIVSKIIQGSLYSEIASGIPEILPPIVFSYKDSCFDNDGIIKNIHSQQLIIPKGFFNGLNNSPLCSLVTSEELCGICTIPVDNTIGFEIKKSKGYSINSYISSTDVLLGNICEYERPLLNIKFGLSEEDLNKHTFVCGITGSGKTNSVKNILESINKPFMVIEPAKKEYRNLQKNVEVYTLGRPEINCIKLNPFYIIPGISPQQHIDFLKDLFCASFALYGPMPYILEKCLYNIYIKKGWNLTLGFHPSLVGDNGNINLFDEGVIKEKYSILAHKYLFPTMHDLKDEVDYYIENEMTYEGEIKGNIKSAIKARIDSLCVGAKGYMFNTFDITNFDNIFNNNVVLELEGLADDADKAFSLGLLIIYLNEYRQLKKETEKVKGLEHILVIEEAHRLLKNISSETNEDIGNPKGKAVEHFTNILAEMRSYGQGVIVAEQIPSKLAPDVIKNSSNKIIHRIVAFDDQQAIANTIGVSTEDAIYLGNHKTGYALCHKEGMIQPVIVKIQEITKKNISDTKLYKKNIDSKFFDINKSIISNHLPKNLSVWAVKTLISLMYMLEANKIYSGLEIAYESLDKQIILKSITMIPKINKKDCIISCIIDEVISLLISGVFSNHQIPPDDMISLITNTIKIPTKEKIQELNKHFEKYYKKNPRNKAIEIVSALVSIEFSKGYNIEKMIGDFMLYEDKDFIKDVRAKLQ
jgi:hypothetical protein